MRRVDPGGVSEQLRLAAARRPAHTVLGFPDDRVSYQELYELSTRIGRSLASLRIAPGEAVGILGLNSIESMAALFGVIGIGAVPVPINNRFKEFELAYVIEHAELAAIITADRESDPISYASMIERVTTPATLRERVQLGDVAEPGFRGRTEFLALAAHTALDPAAAPASTVAGDEVAVLMYTSGTTGSPRGCLLSHDCLVTASDNLRRRIALTEADVMWDVLPFFHLSGVIPTLTTIMAGSTMLSMRHFEGRAALDQLEHEHVTVAIPAFETIWMDVLTQPDFASRDLSRLRFVQNVGVGNRLRHMQEQLPHTIQVSNFGMTELGGYATMHALTDDLQTRTSTGGIAMGGMELRIVDEAGQPMPFGQRGEIVARGNQMFSGYFKDPAATAASFDDEGWFHSGDLGTMTETGQVTFVGRRKDMLKVGGENVAAAEIETYLVTHPAVQIAVIVAAADARYEQVPAAFVQVRPGASLSESELIDFCIGKIASYKVPRYVRFVDSWPMSGTKIQKFRLREAINDELTAQGITMAPKVTEREARQTISEPR